MNIVKFRDVVIEDDIYNHELKGKYVYCVHWTYLLPLDTDIQEIIRLEKTSSLELDRPLLSTYSEYIDLEKTEEINQKTVDKLLYLNNLTPDDDITIEELKIFRRWLAIQLLGTVEDTKDITMLNYYANDMMDDTIHRLIDFTSTQVSIVAYGSAGIGSIKHSSCGCSSNTRSTINSSNICDAIDLYTSGIYNYMIEVFSNIEFWSSRKEIVTEVIKYLENIIRVGLPLTSVTTTNYIDCTCTNIDSTQQELMTQLLRKLITSLGYIVDGDVAGNKYFISNTLREWSTLLYEKMFWM